jgi:hypothetical protein
MPWLAVVVLVSFRGLAHFAKQRLAAVIYFECFCIGVNWVFSSSCKQREKGLPLHYISSVFVWVPVRFSAHVAKQRLGSPLFYS